MLWPFCNPRQPVATGTRELVRAPCRRPGEIAWREPVDSLILFVRSQPETSRTF